MDGVINVFKNKGMSSFDVVKKVRKVSKERKVGHTGTLDPEATGVLPVCLGKATKIIDYIMTAEKSYFVTFKLGVKTTTYDLEGEVVSTSPIDNIDEKQVLNSINKFIGEINQVPPMYSALKQNGVRLYDLARQGIEVEREARKVTIYSIKDIEVKLPYVSMEVTCSKGTYIRSLCYDIGEDLSVGATMTELRRTKTSVFYEEDSINIDKLDENNVNDYCITIEEALKMYPAVKANEGYDKYLRNGVKLADKRAFKTKADLNVLYRVYDSKDNFLGLGKQDKQGFKMEKLLV